MVDYIGLAVGHNQTPVALHLLSAPLFWRYELLGTVDDKWIQPRRAAGDRSLKRLPPSIIWTLAAITEAERDYLLTNIYTAESVELTIRSPKRNAAGSPYTNFNTVSYLHEMTERDGSPEYGAWLGVRLEHIRLEAI